MEVMETQTASFAKMFGTDSKTYLFLPKSVKLATKLVSYDSIRVMQYYANLSQLSFSSTNVIHCLPFSQSEVGIGTETGLHKSVCVKFQLEKECQFGDRFFIVGDDPVMGSWSPSDAIPLNWSEGHIWSLLLELPVEKSIQYKVFLKKSTGEIMWQPGPDRSFQTWETKNVITVSEEWENAEAQKTSEEELMPKTLVEPSVLASHEDPKKEHALAMNSSTGDLGSDNASAEDKNGAHPKESAFSSGGKKEKNTDGKNQRNKMPLEKGIKRQTKADKYSAEQEDEGILVTNDEGPVLVPGLTLLVLSTEEDFANDN